MRDEVGAQASDADVARSGVESAVAEVASDEHGGRWRGWKRNEGEECRREKGMKEKIFKKRKGEIRVLWLFNLFAYFKLLQETVLPNTCQNRNDSAREAASLGKP